MKVKATTSDEMLARANDAISAATTKAEKDAANLALGNLYRSAKFEFGAQFKADAKFNVNDNFSYSTQLVLFANYLDSKRCPRINWDNRFDWKLAKYFSLRDLIKRYFKEIAKLNKFIQIGNSCIRLPL